METQTVMKYPLCDNSDNNNREESVSDFGKLECCALLDSMEDAGSGSVEQNQKHLAYVYVCMYVYTLQFRFWVDTQKK